MSTGQQIGLIGSSVRVQSLPTASAATFGEGNRFYTLIGQQAGYITGHTYRTVMANDVYSWEDVRNELMLLALVDGTITANSSIEVALSNFNRQPLVDNLLIVYSTASQYALMKVSAVTSTAATLIVKDNSASNIVSTKGETGAAGVGITNATAGESIVADGKTTTPITFSFSDGTTKEFNVEAQNGTDGTQGIGVKSITSGTPTVVNDKTNTPILITLTDNTTVDLVVSAENGKDGTSATVDIVQVTGQSTTAVMSQKAVTDELNKKANTSDIPTKTSQLTNDSNYATKSYVDTQDNKKLDKAGGSVTGNLTIGGNLIVNGSTTSIDSTTLKVSDKLIEVAKDNTVKLTTPAGIVVPKYDGTSYGALVIDGDGNAQVGDVKLDSSGNIDVTNSDLQILATREGLTDGNLVKWDDTKKTLVPDTTVASNASSALSKANANASEISAIKTTYQTKTDNTLETSSKTVVGSINEVKGIADSANSKASVNATEISNIKNGTIVVKNADHANAAVNATNVTTNINGHAITDIFETNGTTVKEATHAGKATSADKATQANSASKVAKSLTFSGQNTQGTKSTIGFDGSQAQEVNFNGDDFVATKGNAFEVSLAPSGVTAGTYNNVTIDEKGRVTAGSNKDYATTAQVNDKYTKPSDGIPKSDLTVSVQTSLDKADTALQSAPVTSVNGKTGDVQLGASDVGALPTSTKYVVSVNGESGEVKNIAKTNSANTFTGDQTVTGNGSVSGNFTVGGNLTINGTTTTVDSTTLQVKDKLIEVAHGNTTSLTTPAGLVAPKYDGANSGALVFDSTGTAYVGDVTLKDGNIDVANSGLQPLATRTGLVGGNLVQYDSSALTLKDSGKKISDLALKTDLSGKLSKTENTGVSVLGTTKSTTTLGGNQLVAPNGIIFAGTAANAGLVTRGICGVSTPDSNGACSKENLYINYDGNNDFNAGRQVVLNAGAVGNHLGSNMYQYAVPRGDIVKAWVESKGYATTSQVNAKYTKPSGGIPKTDLASDVQTSLGKADTALQSETDPTVPPWAKASSKPTYTASEVGALSLDGGTINKSKTIKMDASANSDGANLKWGTVNSKNPYIGYASDQVDGTFVVGSLLGTNYASGLAIGGGSGNLLWKGTRVATTNDIPNVSGKANLSGGNTFDSQQIFEDITGTTTINGSYVTIQPTGAQGAYSFEALNSNNTTAFSINGDSSGRIKVGSPVELGNGFGTSGQVLTSQGAGETPTWTTPAIKSVSLSGTTLTITL